MLGDHERFDQEAIDGLVWRGIEGERGEVDLLVPELEQMEIGVEAVDQRLVRRDPRLAGPFPQPVVELPWRHRPTD